MECAHPTNVYCILSQLEQALTFLRHADQVCTLHTHVKPIVIAMTVYTEALVRKHMKASEKWM